MLYAWRKRQKKIPFNTVLIVVKTKFVIHDKANYRNWQYWSIDFQGLNNVNIMTLHNQVLWIPLPWILIFILIECNLASNDFISLCVLYFINFNLKEINSENL